MKITSARVVIEAETGDDLFDVCQGMPLNEAVETSIGYIKVRNRDVFNLGEGKRKVMLTVDMGDM